MARGPLLLATMIVMAIALLACNASGDGDGAQDSTSDRLRIVRPAIPTATPPPPTEEPAPQRLILQYRLRTHPILSWSRRESILYQQYCASCHGVDLEGQPNWRQRDENGFLPAPPHDASGHTWHHPDQLLFDVTKYGTTAFVGSGYKSNYDRVRRAAQRRRDLGRARLHQEPVAAAKSRLHSPQ